MGSLNFFLILIIMILSISSLISSNNLFKKLMSLVMFQTSVIYFFIVFAYNKASFSPILKCLNYDSCPEIYSNALMHSLMLTAIVVGIAIMAIGLGLIYYLNKNFGSLDEQVIIEQCKND